MRLTPGVIENARYEGKSYRGKRGRKSWSRHVLRDDLVPGLGVRISHTGRKTFFVSYRDGGRTRTKTLGRFGALSLAQARTLARELIAAAAGGEPLPEAAAPAERLGTVADLCAAYVDRDLEPRPGRGLVQQRLIRQQLLPLFGHVPLETVGKQDVLKLRTRVTTRYPAQARQLSALLAQMFRWAEVQGLWPVPPGGAGAASRPIGTQPPARREAAAAPAAAGASRAPAPRGGDRSAGKRHPPPAAGSAEVSEAPLPRPATRSAAVTRASTAPAEPPPLRLEQRFAGYLPDRFSLVAMSWAGLEIETTFGLEVGHGYAFRVGDEERWAEIETTVLRCRLARTEQTSRGEVRPVYEATLACDRVSGCEPADAWSQLLDRAGGGRGRAPGT